MKPDVRVRTVGSRVSEEEYAQLEKLAQAQGQTLKRLVAAGVAVLPQSHQGNHSQGRNRHSRSAGVARNPAQYPVPHRERRQAHGGGDAQADRAGRRRQGTKGAGKADRESERQPMNRRPKGWPSPVWWATLGAFAVSVLLAALGVWLDYQWNVSFLEKFYLRLYVKTWAADINPIPHKATARYQLLEAVPKKDKQRLALPGEVEEGQSEDGKLIYVLTDLGRQDGAGGPGFPCQDAGSFDQVGAPSLSRLLRKGGNLGCLRRTCRSESVLRDQQETDL